MNNSHSPSSHHPADKQPDEESSAPKSPPLSSPQEPTRAYPTDPARTYSSDPSQYAYPPNKPAPEEGSKIYTTEPLDTARIAGEERRSAETQDQKRREAFQDQTQQTSHTTNQTGNFYQYMASHREQTITYILLILGLILLLFANSLLGGLILGMVAGYYFSADIISYLRHFGQIAGNQGHLRYAVLAAVLLGLFIAAPGIFIGAIIVATFKQVMAGPRGPS
jgi:hypothetical protein